MSRIIVEIELSRQPNGTTEILVRSSAGRKAREIRQCLTTDPAVAASCLLEATDPSYLLSCLLVDTAPIGRRTREQEPASPDSWHLPPSLEGIGLTSDPPLEPVKEETHE